MRIDRREFLKISAAAGVSLALGGHFPEIKAQAKVEISEVDRERAYTNPLELADSVIERIIQEKSRRELIPWEQHFVNLFSTTDSVDKPGVEKRREIIRKGFSLYGKEIYRQVREMEKGDFKNFFNVFKICSAPIEDLLQAPPAGSNPTYGYIFPQTFLQFAELLNWMEPLTQSDDYSRQKEIYLQRATRSIDNSTLIKDFDSDWKLMRKLGKEFGDENERTGTQRKVISTLINTIRKHFPNAYMGVYINDTTATDRAYFNMENVQGIFLNRREIEQVAEGYLEYLEAPESEKKNLGQSFIFQMNSLVRTQLHELAHRQDPNQFQEPLTHDRHLPYFPYNAHPADYLNYNASYVDFFNRARDIFVSNDVTGIDIEQLFGRHPHYTPRFLPTMYGVDELSGPRHINYFLYECDTLEKVCQSLESLGREGQAMIKELGMDYLFRKNGPEFRFWKEAKVFGYLAGSGKDRKPIFRNKDLGRLISNQKNTDVSARLTKFGGISSESIRELRQFSLDVVNSQSLDEYAKASITNELLRVQSAYLFSTFMLLEKMFDRGLLGDNEAIFSNFRETIRDMVFYQWQHILVGPLGTYIDGISQRSVFKNQSIQVEKSLGEYESQAHDRKEYELMVYGKKLENEAIVEFAHLLNRQVVVAQGKRACMWGAESDSVEAIAACSRDILEQLGIEYSGLLPE